ncbi:hypothetical protein ACIGO8_06230 [Streptomyces sp. NPDC053493]|uniref:hypothetical protein n=1 Tax=Streptomyces sp. NPDC053493 TaxID=3365705 RepID=UPI0037D358D4
MNTDTPQPGTSADDSDSSAAGGDQSATGRDAGAPGGDLGATTGGAAAEAPAERASRWPLGCGIAMFVLLGLLGLGAWALQEFEKGLDGYGQLEQSGSTGMSGSVASPFAAGMTARYEDGLKVTVSPPHADAGGRTYSFTVTYENDTDGTIRPGGESLDSSVSTYGQAPLVVRAGRSLDDHTADYTLDWPDWRGAASVLLPPLAEGETRTVPVRIEPSRKGIPVTVEVAPPDAGYRETAHFQLQLD